MPTTKSATERRWVESQKGQVLLIFSLSAIVLFAIMGLAVDAGISYLHSDQQQKAAAAAALSGVGYLPGDFTDAQKEATLTAQRDGYTAGGTGVNTVTISVTEPTGYTNELQVAITAPAPVYFLDLFGFGTHEVTASAVAEYLPPIQLGEPGSQLGATVGSLNKGGDDYFLRTEGWGNPRSEGDPFTPTPNEEADSCGPSDTSCVASSPDTHQISCIDGDDLCNDDQNGSTSTDCGTANNLCLNDNGGENYLIWVPAGTDTSVDIYNPSFDPGNDSDCSSQTTSCLDTMHEDDSSFPGLTSDDQSSVPDTDYDTMGYTIFAVPDLNDRSGDIPLLQDLFCPFNAYNLDQGNSGWSYYKEGTNSSECNPADDSQTGNLTTETGTPSVFNSPTESTPNWVPLTSYDPTTGINSYLFYRTYNELSSESSYTQEVGSSYYLYGGASGQYFRLRVDTLAWNGAVINSNTGSNTSPSINSSSLPDGYPLGHNGYSVLASTASSTVGAQTACSGCTVSAMADMTMYTPIDGAIAPNFDVQLFYLPEEYAGKTITVSAFDPGDVGGGDAYLGILQPAYTSGTTNYPLQYATLATGSNNQPAVYDLGNDLNSGSDTDISPNDGTNPNNYPYTSSSAIVQTADGGGGAIYNGQWIQFTITVPSNFDPGSSSSASNYWDLYYQVSSNAYAGDTLAFEVQYLGSPVHLCSEVGCP